MNLVPNLTMSSNLTPKLSFCKFKCEDSDYASLHKRLSPFQIKKFTFFFKKFFDVNNDGIVDALDFTKLNERLRIMAGWGKNSEEYMTLADTNSVFLECLLDQVKKEGKNQEGLEYRTWEEALKPRKLEVTSITLNQWLNMWARLCEGSGGMQDFPIWVKLLPQLMFAVQVGKNKEKQITKACLKNFYACFAEEMEEKELEELTEVGYASMTAHGDYELDEDNYVLLFSSFLLGRTIYGPGKYIFGCLDNSDLHTKYPIIPLVA